MESTVLVSPSEIAYSSIASKRICARPWDNARMADMSDLDRTVRERAERFAQDIAALVRQSIADEVIRIVGSKSGNGAAAKPAKSNLATSRAKSAKVSDEQVLAAMRGKKGVTAAEVAKATGLAVGAVGYRLNKLRAAKKVRMMGQRSAARYFAA